MTPRNRTIAAGMTGLTVLWTICVVIQVRQKPLWFDEIFTAWLVRQPPLRILKALRLDSGPPLFYFLEKPFVLLGERLGDDRILRLPSLLAVTLLFALACRRRVAPGPRFLLLLATSPLLFFYAAEGRSYAVLSLVSFVLFLVVTRLPADGRSTVFAAAASTALIGLHYIGIFVVGGAILAAFVAGRRRLAIASAAGALVASPWIPFALAQPAASMSWSQERPGPSLARTIGQFAFWTPAPGYFSSAVLPVPAAGVILGAIVIVLTVFAVSRRRLLPAAVFVLFPLVASVLAGAWRPIYFAGRTEMAIWPGALWLIARASRISAPLRAATGIAAAAGAATIVLALARPPQPAPYVQNARLATGLHPPPALVVATDADYLPLRLAADRGQLTAALAGLPRDLEFHPGWFLPLNGFQARREAEALDRRLAALPRSSTAAILLPSDPILARAVSAAILAPRQPAVRLRVQGNVLFLTN